MTSLITTPARHNRVFITIKVLHTVIWSSFVGCIFAIPVTGFLGRFRVAWVLSAVVMGEGLALAVNGGHCPLTPLAARFTTERQLGFDIYLPGWVARWNKVLFGSIFVAGEFLLLWRQFR